MNEIEQRLTEIRARAESGEPGSNTRDLGPVVLSCMDPQARDLMETALEQYRAFHARHLETIAEAWRNSPEWGGMWESIGADQAYLFAYWLFRHSGLVDAHARADIPFLLEQVTRARGEGLRQAAEYVRKDCRCHDDFKKIGRVDPYCQACDLAAELDGQADDLLLSEDEKRERKIASLERLLAHCEAEAERFDLPELQLHRKFALEQAEVYRARLAVLKAQEP